MRLLELIGSAFLITWFVGMIIMTAMNLSRFLFTLEGGDQQTHFWSRQFTIFVWPLIALSSEGRLLLIMLWEGRFS